jgi:hypothetical protein
VHCPICAQALEQGEIVMVCGQCHKALGGGLSLGATGEFKVPSEEIARLAVMGGSAALPQAERVHATNVCSWCGKLEAEVKKLLGRGNAALCNECVALACDVMEAELGGDWR